MYERKIALAMGCGLSLTREVLNGKWKASLVFAISENIRRPSDLHRAMPDASKRVLNLQLRELETHGIITRIIYHQLPPKVEYTLTPLGESLIPLIHAMNNWGDDNRAFLETVIDGGKRTEPSTTIGCFIKQR